MKICAIGDPHGDLKKIKKIPLRGVDLILITGDIGSCNLIREMTFNNIKREKDGLEKINYTKTKQKQAIMEPHNSSMKIIKYLKKYAPVLTIFGNVECTNKDIKKQEKEIGEPLPKLYDELNALENVEVINNKIRRIKNTKIGGLKYFTDTNWVQDFKPKNYTTELKHAKKETKRAKEILKWFNKLDILICHQPPHKTLDKVSNKYGAPKQWWGKHAGSKTIRKYIEEKQPRYVFCGHIHEGAGKTKIGKTEIYNLGVGEYKIIKI